MQISGSGGLGAVSFGISETAVVVVVVVLAVGVWKLLKLLWAAFAG